MSYEEQQRQPEPDKSLKFIDRWINLGLKAEYPFIETNSFIAELGLQLYEDAEEAERRQNELYESQEDGWKDAAHESQLADKRVWIFRNMGHDLDMRRRQLNDTERMDPSMRLQDISAASERSKKSIERVTHFSDEERSGLDALVDTLSFEYWADESHFQPPKQD